jgi:hypothetical protein
MKFCSNCQREKSDVTGKLFKPTKRCSTCNAGASNQAYKKSRSISLLLKEKKESAQNGFIGMNGEKREIILLSKHRRRRSCMKERRGEEETIEKGITDLGMQRFESSGVTRVLDSTKNGERMVI